MYAVIGGLEWFKDQEEYWAPENQLLENPMLDEIYIPERILTSIKYLRGKLFSTKRISRSKTKK